VDVHIFAFFQNGVEFLVKVRDSTCVVQDFMLVSTFQCNRIASLVRVQRGAHKLVYSAPYGQNVLRCTISVPIHIYMLVSRVDEIGINTVG
jgi:hypothetical protein